MTSTQPDEPEDPRSLLVSARGLTDSVRRDQGGGWFALLVFGVLTLLAVPFFRYGPHGRHCALHDGVPSVCTVYPTLVLWYWPVALVAGYAAIGAFYLRLSRRRGVGTRVQPFIAFGVLLGLLAAGWALWAFSHPAFLAGSLHVGPPGPGNVLFRLTSPAGAIGLALLVLAWIERSWALAAVTAVYLVAVGSGLDPARTARPSPWVFLPHLLLVGAILLVGAGLVALLRRVSRPSVA